MTRIKGSIPDPDSRFPIPMRLSRLFGGGKARRAADSPKNPSSRTTEAVADDGAADGERRTKAFPKAMPTSTSTSSGAAALPT